MQASTKKLECVKKDFLTCVVLTLQLQLRLCKAMKFPIEERGHHRTRLRALPLEIQNLIEKSYQAYTVPLLFKTQFQLLLPIGNFKHQTFT